MTQNNKSEGYERDANKLDDVTECAPPQVFEITLSRGYGESNFREDLKSLYLKLAIDNKKTVFLFTDAHVAEEGFLELINNMLTSG